VSVVVGASLSAVKVRAHRDYRRLREIIAPEADRNPEGPSDISDMAKKP
jgi:hypothetical protein